MNIIRKFVINYIASHMGHHHSDTHDAIFKAINDGMKKEFYEDNVYTRMNYTVLQLTKNGEDFGSVYYQQNLARTAASAVCEALDTEFVYPNDLERYEKALKDIRNYCVTPVPEDPCHADFDTIGDIATKALNGSAA